MLTSVLNVNPMNGWIQILQAIQLTSPKLSLTVRAKSKLLLLVEILFAI